MATIIASIGVFAFIIILLVGILLIAKHQLVHSGAVAININDEKQIQVASGGTLLATLGEQGIFLPSACGGGGSCLQCKCQVLEGGGTILPTETPHFTRKEIQEGWRLGCQVKIKESLSITVPEEVFGVKKWQAKVVSNYNVASFIKEFVIELPEEMNYKPGGYIQIEIPRAEINYADIDITAHPEDHPEDPNKFKAEWDKFKLWPLTMKNNASVERAYSMASYPAEGRRVMLNVRIATPPFDRAKNGWASVNPGVASSYVFSRKPGDIVTISGPFGEFFINESDSEMLYIGGGAGMAPLRSQLFHLFKTLKTGRKVSYWYGGRSKRELFYLDHFKQLQAQFDNFSFYIGLSDPSEADQWKIKESLQDKEGDGFVGFIHEIVLNNYLKHHEAPEDIEYYLCGPPLMSQAVQKMCDDLGVPNENVRFDDFGG